MNAMDEIIPGLWIGGLLSAMDTENLKANKIYSVLSAMRGKISIHEVRFLFVVYCYYPSETILDFYKAPNPSGRYGGRGHIDTSTSCYYFYTGRARQGERSPGNSVEDQGYSFL